MWRSGLFRSLNPLSVPLPRFLLDHLRPLPEPMTPGVLNTGVCFSPLPHRPWSLSRLRAQSGASTRSPNAFQQARRALRRPQPAGDSTPSRARWVACSCAYCHLHAMAPHPHATSSNIRHSVDPGPSSSTLSSLCLYISSSRPFSFLRASVHYYNTETRSTASVPLCARS